MIERIKISLVPDSLMGISLKNGLKASDWKILRNIAYKKSNGKCMCCGKKISKFEAHEVWDYNKENKVCKLTDIIAVCHLCHNGIHMNRAILCENIEIVEKNYMSVNKATYSEMKQALKIANEEQKELSKIQDWKIDLSFLKEFIK